MLTPNLSLGGAERWVASLITHSPTDRLQWTGVALSGFGGVQPDLCAELAHHCPIFGADIVATLPDGSRTPAGDSPDCSRFITRVGSLESAIQQAAHEADILVTWGAIDYSLLVHRLCPYLPTVVVSHSSHTKPAQVPPGITTHLVAVSEAAKRPLTFPGNPEATVIYNGAEEKRLGESQGRDRIRQTWGLAPHHRVVGYIGRQTTEKNPGAAIHAVRTLGEPWRAVYYGSKPTGQPGPDLVGLAASAPGRVRFHPPVIRIGDVYAGLDVLLLASHTEAFSLTLIEAWLTRVPVVATPVGSVPELQAKHGQLVFEVPPNPTPQQLAGACRAAIDPRNELVIERAYQLAVAEFTATAMANRWADYLTHLLQPVTKRRPLLNL